MAAVLCFCTPLARIPSVYLTGLQLAALAHAWLPTTRGDMQRHGAADGARLKGRSSTGVTLALPRSSGANAAAHARHAATLIHTRASIANST